MCRASQQWQGAELGETAHSQRPLLGTQPVPRRPGGKVPAPGRGPSAGCPRSVQSPIADVLRSGDDERPQGTVSDA